MPISDVIVRNNVTYSWLPLQWGDGHINCHARGVIAYADSYLTCAAFQLPFWLESIGFGYLTVGLSSTMILISLFGGIRENYKWFILNQAIWDLLVSYDFICDKPSHARFLSVDEEVAKQWNQGPATCFYSTNATSFGWRLLLSRVFDNALNDIQFALLFMLAFSRFLTMYYPKFVEKHITTKRIIIFICVFNILSIFLLTALDWYYNIQAAIVYPACEKLYCKNGTQTCDAEKLQACKASISPGYPTFGTLSLGGLQYIFVVIWLLFTFIFTLAIFVKICRQIKYQYHHNKKSLSASMRISCVLLFQSVIFFVFFSLNFLDKFLMFWVNAVITAYKGTLLSLNLPNWVQLLIYYPGSLNVLRVFLDSIIVLTVLTGYRKALIRMINCIIKFIIHPRQSWQVSPLNVSLSSTAVFIEPAGVKESRSLTMVSTAI